MTRSRRRSARRSGRAARGRPGGERRLHANGHSDALAGRMLDLPHVVRCELEALGVEDDRRSRASASAAIPSCSSPTAATVASRAARPGWRGSPGRAARRRPGRCAPVGGAGSHRRGGPACGSRWGRRGDPGGGQVRAGGVDGRARRCRRHARGREHGAGADRQAGAVGRAVHLGLHRASPEPQDEGRAAARAADPLRGKRFRGGADRAPRGGASGSCWRSTPPGRSRRTACRWRA